MQICKGGSIWLIYPTFLKIPNANEIICAKRGLEHPTTHENPLDPWPCICVHIFLGVFCVHCFGENMSTALRIWMSYVQLLSRVVIGFVILHDACFSLLCIILFVTCTWLYVSTNNNMLSPWRVLPGGYSELEWISMCVRKSEWKVIIFGAGWVTQITQLGYLNRQTFENVNIFSQKSLKERARKGVFHSHSKRGMMFSI